MSARDGDLAELKSRQNLTTTNNAADYSGWEQWLRGRLNIELANLHRALGEVLATERMKFERRTGEFEVKIAKLSGAIDVLRGAAPPPPAKFPTAKLWEDRVFHENDVVTFCGSTYQALRDTARVPTTSDWRCLAAGGSGFVIRGTYDTTVEYRYLDVAMVNGNSFAALKDNPGPCPGDDWHLLASRGSRGSRGERGPVGIAGLRGERGVAAPTIQSWQVDRSRYLAIPIMSDGSTGPALELRALFEQYFAETAK
jgi:hypothetical protein